MRRILSSTPNSSAHATTGTVGCGEQGTGAGSVGYCSKKMNVVRKHVGKLILLNSGVALLALAVAPGIRPRGRVPSQTTPQDKIETVRIRIKCKNKCRRKEQDCKLSSSCRKPGQGSSSGNGTREEKRSFLYFFLLLSSRFVCDKFLGHNVSAFLCECRACCHLLLLQLAALILLTCLLLGATRALCCHCRLSILTRTSDFVLDLASSISITPRFPCACRTS